MGTVQDLARGRRVAGRRKPQQLLTLVAEHQKCEELLKAIVGTRTDQSTQSPPYDSEAAVNSTQMQSSARRACCRTLS
jgi:hypothetical protein